MTKPKIANGNSINPLSRLEKRLQECKNHHNESISNCNKIQESHNKINLELKLTLERKSKISDSKVKKKRSTNGTSVNRKKSKIVPEKLQSKQYFENCLEATPNVSLNVHSSEFPDIDLDTFDILKDSNFPISINEQELDSVLNNCCAPAPPPTLANDLFSNQMPSEQTYSYKSSIQPKIEPVTSVMTTKKFKMEESVVNTPLFPPPEIPINSSRLSSGVDYSSLGYLPPPSNNNNSNSNTSNNANYAASIVPTPANSATSDSMKYYSLNLAPPMSTQNPAAASSSYNYLHYSSARNPMAPDIMPTNSHSNGPSQQYFYQYVNFPSSDIVSYADHPSNGSSGTSFQLPAMSTGWYNTPPAPAAKQLSCKPQLAPQQNQQPQQFASIPSTSSNYLHNNFPHYPIEPSLSSNNGSSGNNGNNNHPLLCQPVNSLFNGHYDPGTTFPSSSGSLHHHSSGHQQQQQQQQQYNHLMGQPNLTSYNIVPDQNPYYYVDYCNVATIANRNGSSSNNSGLSMIVQNDSQFMANHNGGGNLCRNVYPSHCI